MAGVERIYANRTCPYCEVSLEPLPTVRGSCPECGRTIHAQTGPDGLTYLVRTTDLAVLEAAWADYEDARHAVDPDLRRVAAERYLDSTLSSYRGAGIRTVEVSTDEDPCPSCARLAGQAYTIEDAPILPNRDCEREFCRCDYVPVLV